MKKAHFIGICGVGMSAVAQLLVEKGWQVTGSDEGFYPPMSDYLQHLAIPCETGYRAENIPQGVDQIVIGKHAKLVPESNDEVRAAFESGAPVRSFPDVLHDLTQSTRNLVVVGSFGKSSCTALAAWVLRHAGKDPSFFVGALTRDLPSNAHLGKGPLFVLEGDEYPSSNWDDRSKFLYYNASSVLLTSGTHDHVNVFPTLESYLKPFRELVSSLPSEGLVVGCLDGEHVPELMDESPARRVTYSLSNPTADWHSSALERGSRTSFDLFRRGERLGRLSTGLLGDHNVQNIVGVAAFLIENGAVTLEELGPAVAEFRGVRRRLEAWTPDAAVQVYEDFGSSYAKARAGMDCMRQYFPGRRLFVVFEPHTFSFRNRNALGWYSDLFDGASRVFVYEPPRHGAETHAQLSQAEIVGAVQSSGLPAQGFHSSDELLTELSPRLRPDDVVLMITSGDLGGSIPAVADWVKSRF